ncbi:MAG: amidohydrolase family protein [Planctomycetes bacterium]|nr:amidohydrolase family protein [Planctomycetota bacterium]
MIIDCHTHIDFSGNDAAASGDHITAAEPVDICIVLARPDSDAKVNKKLSEYVANNKNKMIGFAFAEPTGGKTSVKYLDSITNKLGLAGVVLYCCECGFHPAHSKAMQLYESAQELGLPIFFHNAQAMNLADVLDYAQPFLLDEIARTFPDLKIVIGMMGEPFIEQTLLMAAKHKNVYADLTIKPNNIWQTYNTVVAAHESGVMEKLLFGSGFPLSTAAKCIETLLGFNKLLADTNLPTVPRGEIQNIVQRNTLDVLGIKK